MFCWAAWTLKRFSSPIILIEVNLLVESREGVAVLQIDLVLVGAEAFWMLPDCFTSDLVKSGKESSTCRKVKHQTIWHSEQMLSNALQVSYEELMARQDDVLKHQGSSNLDLMVNCPEELSSNLNHIPEPVNQGL